MQPVWHVSPSKGMHLFKKKTKTIRRDETKETGNTAWKLQHKTAAADRLEDFINTTIHKRSRNWCRACHSEDCQFDQVQPAVPRSSFDDNFREQLDTLRNKRIALEEYLGRVEKLNTSCRLGLLRQPYLPSQHQLPPWLAGVLESELSLPLVPTFASAGNALKILQDELRFVPVNNGILKEYEAAASCARRVKIKVANQDVNVASSHTKLPVLSVVGVASSHTKLPVLSVVEEISDGSWEDESHLFHGVEELHSKSRENSQKILPKSFKQVIKVTADQTTSVGGSQGDDTCTSRQLLENHLQWLTVNRCENSSIEECRDERVLIVGELHETQPKCGAGLPFKLLMFPKKSSEYGKIGIKGTLSRKSVSSCFDLRWRYAVEIDTKHHCS